MRRRATLLPLALLPVLTLPASQPAAGQDPIVHEHVTGLRAPTRTLPLDNGLVLVAEAGQGPNTGRVSLIDRDRRRVTIVDQLPSGLHNAEPSGPSALHLVGNRLYILIGNGDTAVRGPVQGSEVANPNASSPLFSSLLLLEMDEEGGRFPTDLSLPADWHARVAAGETVHLQNPSGHARLSRVADFEDVAEPRPDVPNNLRISNPFNLSGNGSRVDVADASRNLLWRVSLSDGATSIVTRFDGVPNPTPAGPRIMDAVPASVRGFRDDLLVSYLTGAPFVPGAASVQIVDRQTGTSRPLIRGLQTAIDVMPVTRGRGLFYVLEFSSNMMTRAPGRVLRFDAPDAAPLVMAAGLPSPTSMAIDPATGDLLVTDLRGGRLLLVQLPR
jgi:hypothetical protein